MNAPTKALALLIDGDNAQLPYSEQIIQFCKGYGTLKIKKAYGDWKQSPLSSHSQTMIALGIKRVQQNRVGKNAADFRLAMDVPSMLDKGEVDIYIIVSGDGHFTTVCERIRQKGAKVIGIGSKSNTSSQLRKSCNEFFDVEEIINKQSSPSPKTALAPKSKTTPKAVIVKNQTKPPAKSATAPKSKTTTMLDLLIQAYEKTTRLENGWVDLGELGNVLRQLDKQFDERFAKKKLSTWFKDFADKFEVDNNRVRMR